MDAATATTVFLLPRNGAHDTPRLLALPLMVLVLPDPDKTVFLRLDVGEFSERGLRLEYLTLLSILLKGIFFGCSCDPLKGAAACVVVRVRVAVLARVG